MARSSGVGEVCSHSAVYEERRVWKSDSCLGVYMVFMMCVECIGNVGAGARPKSVGFACVALSLTCRDFGVRALSFSSRANECRSRTESVKVGVLL